MKKNLLLGCLIISILGPGIAFGQQFVSAPVMTTPVSTETNGMGGASASVISDNALATIANPAQLGLFSLDNRFNAGTLLANTSWPSGFQATDNTVYATALNAGVELNRWLNLPVPISFGAGYSRVYMDQNNFELTPFCCPQIVSLWQASQTIQGLTLSVGLDYWVRLGLGYNLKWLNSKLTDAYPTTGLPPAEGNAAAHDYGLILDIPVVEILSRLNDRGIMIGHNLSPVLDLTVAYARRNIGDGIYYTSPDNTHPFPREGVLGLSTVIGLRSEVNGKPWTLLSFTWAREATANLVAIDQVPVATPDMYGDTLYSYYMTYSYKSGIGDISPIDNLIFGRSNGAVALSKGWQLQIAELLYLRGGSYTNPFAAEYHTFGLGLRLDGLMKILAAYDLVDIDASGVAAFVVNHLDLQYDYSNYTSISNINTNGTSFHSLNLVVK